MAMASRKLCCFQIGGCLCCEFVCCEKEMIWAVVFLGMLLVSGGDSASIECNYTNQECGNVVIPYPFGMDSACGLPDYRINCTPDATLTPGQSFPFLQLPDYTNQFQVLEFNTSFVLINATHIRAASCDNAITNTAQILMPALMPFEISASNVFAVVGCSFYGKLFTSFGYSGCTNPCRSCDATPNCSTQSSLYPFCNTPGCCIIPLYFVPDKTINFTGQAIDSQHCGFSALLHPDTYIPADDSTDLSPNGRYALNLTWGLPSTQNCATLLSTPAYQCSPIADCVDVLTIPGYTCACTRSGFHGDGYQNGTGCQDINECLNSASNNCVPPPSGICINTYGSYTCSCSDGYQGDGITTQTGCIKVNNRQQQIIIIATALSTATVIGLTGLSLWLVYRLRTSRMRKAKNFEKNGGIRLQQHVSAAGGRGTPRLYSEAELKKATHNFAPHLQLGRGGYGTVYKGILSDGVVVAIKKSNHTQQHEVDQFINEVVILSQINHRNIVHLLGCCLETPVPLLVYEYLSNGTLTEHLHALDGRFLSWESRLLIALESAQAISYLHSCASPPIFHRDIKSSNILLDRALTPKVSDFGTSRLVPMDQTHISTVVQGTMGYLDPEYFQTFQLTDKSDVYSFGIVLLELITSLQPVAMERGEEESNLAMLCISRWKAGTFPTLIDPGLRASGNPQMMQSINQVAKLATTCLYVDGHKRPTMKEIYEVLLWIRGSGGALGQAYMNFPLDRPEEEAEPLILRDLEGASRSNQTSFHSFNRSGGLEMAMVESFKMEGGRY